MVKTPKVSPLCNRGVRAKRVPPVRSAQASHPGGVPEQRVTKYAICLFILENTNCTNNTNRRSRKSILAGCYLCLSHTNYTNTIRMIKIRAGCYLAYLIRTKGRASNCKRIPSGWHSCYSPLIKKYSSRMEIRVIREIRVLLNIEILVFCRLNIYEGACMSTTIHQTMSYLYLPDSNNCKQL